MALLSQARKSECGMAQTSSCIAGFNVLNMRYVRTTAGNQGHSQLEVIFVLFVVTILGMVTAPMIVTILLIDRLQDVPAAYPQLRHESESAARALLKW